jgi:hypothetical protein
MKNKKDLTVQNLGGEDVILLQGKHGLDTTKIVSLNETALWLWNRFANMDDFTVEQVAGELASEYGIESELAAADARAWVGMMLQNTLIEQ